MILIVGGVLMPHIASGATHPPTFKERAIAAILPTPSPSWINSILAGIANMVLRITSVFVLFTGTFLSVSVNLTTHISGIYETITGIKAVWITIRDLSSIFIIFSLIYFSIKTILGLSSTSVKQAILNIFMAGVLINFSLFFVRVAIDASNLISLQFYTAIAPNTDQHWTLKQAFDDGGLSNVFMQSLKIPAIYSNKGVFTGADVAAGITIATVAGIIVMVTAGLSFLAAAVAFTARTGILLFIMAISPIYFVGMIFPEVKAKVTAKIGGLLMSQLIFMPVYLALMYIALKIISDPMFSSIFNPTVTGAVNQSAWGPVWLGVILQYTLALIFINLPLVAAISLGGKGMGWVPTGVDIGKKVGGFLGRNTVGWASKGLGKGFDKMAAAAQATPFGRGASTVLGKLGISQGIRGAFDKGEKGKYGGSQSLVDIEKAEKDRTRVVSGVARKKERDTSITAVLGGATTPPEMKAFRGHVGKMGNKEFEDMEFDDLKNPIFASHLSSKQTETLLDADILTPQQKDNFKTARETGLISILASGTANIDTIREHMGKLSGKELSKFEFNSNPAIVALLTNPDVINCYTISQLQEMKDMKGPIKSTIGAAIRLRPLGTHAARGYMNGPQGHDWT